MIQNLYSKKLLYCLSTSFVFVGVLFLLTSSSSARQNSTITVTPGEISVELTDADQIKDTEITINSTFLSSVSLVAALNGVDDSSGTLVAKGSLDENLKNSLSLSQTQVNVPANGNASLYLRVTNSDLLSPGGHYAALTLSQLAEDGSQVNLQSTISISIYIVKRGGEKVDLQITNQTFNKSMFRLPAESTIEYKNNGNVQLTPRASVTVRSSDGKIVYAKGISNEGSRSILPEKSLTDTFSIGKVSSLPLFPKKLKIITEYRADGVANSLYSESYFWYFSEPFILGVVALSVMLTTIIIHTVKRLKNKKGKKSLPNLTSEKIQSKPTMISDIVRVGKEPPAEN